MRRNRCPASPSGSRAAWLCAHSLVVASASLCFAACASAPPVGTDAVVFQNNSPDVVRVYLATGGQQVILRRVAPFESVRIRMREGRLEPFRNGCELVVLPVGSPDPTGARANAVAAIRSPRILMNELLTSRWVYSGNRIMAVPLAMPGGV